MNIYQISQDLLSLFDEIEANGGEITPEQEQELAITQDALKDKVKSYVGVIQHYKDDLAAIKAEEARLKALKDSKQKIIDRLSNVVIKAIDEFGDTTKAGAKFIEYSTGKVSIRKSEAVEVDENVVNHIVKALNTCVNNEIYNNQLDVIDRIDKDILTDKIATMPHMLGDVMIDSGYNVTDADLNHITLDVSCQINLADILDGCAYDVVKEIAKHSLNFEAKPKISKTDLKNELKTNGSCAPNIARLVTNKSLTIK